MDIVTGATDPLQTRADLLVVLCHEDLLTQNSLITRADAALEGLLSRAIADERFAAKPGQSINLHTYGRVEPKRLALIGCGQSATFATAELRAAAGRAARLAAALGARTAALALPEAGRDGDLGRRLQAAAEGLAL